MTKKTPEKFAKAIMIELASIHALVEQVQAYEIAQMAQRQGKSRQDVSDTLTAARAKRVTELDAKMLKFSEMKEDEQAEP